MIKLRVWDLPIRLFHWLLVVSIIGLFVTGKIGGNLMEWHRKIGFFVLGLITFRLVWGVVGNEHARFVNFVRGPGAVLDYMKSLRQPSVAGAAASTVSLGHNPMGALSVLAMLAVVGFQAVSGLFADDEILMKGPYADAVSNATSALFSKWHAWNSNLILALVALHLAAIGYYFFAKKENLVKAMVSGDKVVDGMGNVPEESNTSIGGAFGTKVPETPRPAWLSWFVAIVVGGLTTAVVTRAFG